jgi:voltage-gated potassium channel
VKSLAETQHQSGQPRTPADAAFLERFNRRMRLPIIVSAILPLIVVPDAGGWVADAIGVVTWLVFLGDFIVQERHLTRYASTRWGRFDLFVVLATAPWFLLPGAQAGRFVIMLRVARLARVVVATKGSRRLFERLGRVALFALGVVLVGSLVAYYAEHPTNPGFATFGDALWWGIVTLTTVGYGDIVPKTATGRWAAVAIMVTGIAVLGLLAGSLASFFRLETRSESEGEGEREASEQSGQPMERPTLTEVSSVEATLASLSDEMAVLRSQVHALVQRLTPDGSDPDAH